MEHEFRPMRRKDRQLDEAEALTLLGKGTYGILAVAGDEGWPYAVPMNYVLSNGLLYLHCARAGYKLDAIRRDERVCFTVVLRDELVPAHITTLYESVIVQGTARIVEDEGEALAALHALVDTLGQVSEEIKTKYIGKKAKNTTLIAIRPLAVTGKASRVLRPVEARM